MLDDYPDFLTEADVAHQLALAPSTLKRWRNKREGPPYVHIGKAVRYPKSQLIAWLLSCRVDPSSPE